VELANDLQDGSVRIEVRDDGPGLPPEERERVFERFARRDDARSRDVGGTGLGLPITRELVTRAGGTVRLLDGRPPWSLAALVELPLAVGPDAAPAVPTRLREGRATIRAT
jgi:signal transduction histidine kinase